MKRLLGVALLCLALTGCDNTLFTSGEKGFVSGDGAVTIVPVADREAPEPINGASPIQGETLDGEQLSLDDFAGKTVVIPVWGSWCGPCREEGPMLAAAAADLADDDVAFFGINSRDNIVENAQKFVKNVGITYPSIYNPTGSLLLSFRAGLTPLSIPSVVFVDDEGRVAAAVSGPITRTTLYDVVEEITGAGSS